MDGLSPFYLVLFLDFVLFSHLGQVCLSPDFGSLSVLVSMYEIELLCLLSLVEWPVMVGIL